MLQVVCLLALVHVSDTFLTANSFASNDNVVVFDGEPTSGWHIVGGESKPCNSDFYQNNFLSTREYQTHGPHSVKFS